MTETLTDILGNEIHKGDLVVYPSSTGCSVQMVTAIFDSYNGETARLRRQAGSRWDPGCPGIRFYDTRTGKYVDPYASQTGEHWKVQSKTLFFDRATDEQVEMNALQFRQLPWYDRQRYYTRWQRGELADHIEQRPSGLRPVVIRNVENIIKVGDASDQ